MRSPGTLFEKWILNMTDFTAVKVDSFPAVDCSGLVDNHAIQLPLAQVVHKP